MYVLLGEWLRSAVEPRTCKVSARLVTRVLKQLFLRTYLSKFSPYHQRPRVLTHRTTFMTLPIAPDADPDPTTQLTWSSARPKKMAIAGDSLRVPGVGDPAETNGNGNKGKPGEASSAERRLTTWNLITLSISMAGAQMAWTVELGCVSVTICARSMCMLTQVDSGMGRRSCCHLGSPSRLLVWSG